MADVTDGWDGWRRWRLEQRRARCEKAEQDKKNKPASRFGFLKAIFSFMQPARNVKEKANAAESNSGNS